MNAFNKRNGNELSSSVVVAVGLIKRMKGLLGRKKLEMGESLWLRPCNSIHTIGMKFPIDAVFMDRHNVVVRAREGLPPNRMTGLYVRAASVLELPAGTLAATDTRIGDRIEIS
jgi:uncharacterized membrane protein (UPF0127 family)